MYEVDVAVYRSGKSSVAHGKKMTITPYIDRWVIIWILAGTIPWSGFPLRCLLHEGAHQLARRRCAYGSFTPGDVL